MRKTAIFLSNLMIAILLMSFIKSDKISNTDMVSEPQMIYVQGGTFMMGCTAEQGEDCFDDEKPIQSVQLQNYYIGKYEVTNRQFCEFLNEEGNQKRGGRNWLKMDKYSLIEQKEGKFLSRQGFENFPVINVSWYGAVAYATWLSNNSDKIYRLPSEAEWEYAARGGAKSKKYKYSGSNTLNDVAWFSENSSNSKTGWGYRNDSGVHSVGGKKADELGIYDMSGNANEWCSDIYVNTYLEGNDLKSYSIGSNIVIRGGSWDSSPNNCRVTARNFNNPNNGWTSPDGFRLARDTF